MRSPRPSWKNGFARYAAESADPNAWKGLVGAWFPTLGRTGLMLRDVSSRGTQGTLIGPPTWVASDRGPALNYGGNPDYINLDGPVVFTDPNIMSIAAWVRLPQGAGRQTIFGHSNEAGAFQFEVTTTSGAGSGRIGTIIPGVTVSSAIITWPSTPTWIHCVYTRSGTGSGTHSIYRDGVSLSLSVDVANNYVQPTNNSEIGRRASGSQHVVGLLDNVAIWDRTLAADEVLDLYNFFHRLVTPVSRTLSVSEAPAGNRRRRMMLFGAGA
jgi:hypothetical protein